MIPHNIILNTDSYKFSQYQQTPEHTEYVVCYIESRGGEYDDTVFFGLQMFLREYLTKPITQEMIDDAESFVDAHMGKGIFNRDGWEYILNELDGFLPLHIESVKEGTLVPTGNVLVTVVNTDPNCYWLPTCIETSILRGVWYPTTVATNSWTSRQSITKFMEATFVGSPHELNTAVDSMLHDFGARGVSSLESSGIGGAAHLINFTGSDNVRGIQYANHYYNHPMSAISVPASEHSVTCMWGKGRETDAYRNMAKQYGDKFFAFSVVSDSYDIFNAVENIWGGELKELVIELDGWLVIRPDSGDPATVVAKILLLLETAFGCTYNSKGYKILNHVKVLQGDGITTASIEGILSKLIGYKFSAENVLFGQGGALLQQLDRDTCRWAYKASAALIDGAWIDVFKDPITDAGKRSKRGRLMLYRTPEGEFKTSTIDNKLGEEMLTPVFLNGKILRTTTLAEVRELRHQTTAEIAEVALYEQYIPATIDSSVISIFSSAELSKYNSDEVNMKLMGNIMGKLNKAFPDQIDGKIAGPIIKQLIQEKMG